MTEILIDKSREPATDDRPMVMIDADEFARHALLRGNPLPWTRPSEFVACQGQIMGLLKADVALLDTRDFFSAWLAENRGVLSEMRGKKRNRFALKKLLGMDEPRAVINEIVSGVCASVSEPVVLLLPENREFVRWANDMANGVTDVDISDLDVDSVSVYIADFLRTFAGLSVAGVLLRLPPGATVSSALQELYSPIVNVARHYRWSIGALAPEPSEVADHEGFIDYWISEHSAANGSYFDKRSWTRDEAPRKDSAVYYLEVPGDVPAAAALDKLAHLRAAQPA